MIGLLGQPYSKNHRPAGLSETVPPAEMMKNGEQEKMTEQTNEETKGLKIPAWVLLVGAFAILITVGIVTS